MQVEHQSLPNTDRLSVLTASILLAYALLPFITIPERVLVVQVLGVSFLFRIDFATLIALLSGAMAAAGTSWLLRDHPRLNRPGAAQPRSLAQHWLLPALTAWIIGVPLHSLTVGLQWWAVFALGGVLLVLVLIAEYVVVDPYDTRNGPATVGLTAVAYALFLILTIALAGSGSRLYVLLPGLGLALLLVVLRTLYLRLGGRWCISWSVVITLVIVQAAAALHYWPLTPPRYGLIILGLAYALPSLAGAIEEGRSWRTLWVEPLVMLVILWGLAATL